MHNLQPCARRAHKHPIIDIYLPIVGRIYPIPEYICQLLAEYIPYQNISPIFGRIYLTLNQSSRGRSLGSRPAHHPEENISNTRTYPIPIYIYIQLFIYPPIVGRIYLVPEYIQYQYTCIFNYSYIP